MSPFNPTSRVAAVILNWNGKSYLERFLPHLKASTYSNLHIIVADNGSTDDSVPYLKAFHPDVSVLSYPTNEGFAGGYNRALQDVDEEYLVLLNSDIEVTPGWIEPVMSMFESHPHVAAIQPKIRDYHQRSRFEYAGAAGGWIDALGYPFSRGRIFDVLEEDLGQYDQPTRIFWASGAAMFVRKSVFMKMGGFDSHFFAHMEEIDLCWRMQLAGYVLMSCPDSVVYHIGGGTLPKNNPRKIYLNFRNNLMMLWKNLQGPEAIIKIAARFLLDAVSAWKNLVDGQPAYFMAVMKAHMHFMLWLFKKRDSRFWPAARISKPAGIYQGSVVWQHFAKGKTRFSEIVGKSD